jgi:hypothetical protein
MTQIVTKAVAASVALHVAVVLWAQTLSTSALAAIV